MFHPVHFIYLNPELNLETVEEALAYYTDNPGTLLLIDFDLPEGFDYRIYYKNAETLIANSDFLSEELKDTLSAEQKSVIHYHREGNSLEIGYSVPESFNPDLYRIVYEKENLKTEVECYLDYLERAKTDSAVIGDYNSLANVTISSNLELTSTKLVSENSHWIIQTSNYDLHFKSQNNTKVVFTEMFEPSILNFTGQHHTSMNVKTKEDPEIGMIVSSTGEYFNNSVSINEALPIVELSKTKNDPKAFGVISELNYDGSYKIGYLTFLLADIAEKPMITVNSLGEGGIWVSDTNGMVQNGDLITSSDTPGIGMRQDDDVVHSYTVAKATTSCTLPGRRFIGCVYLN